MSNINELFVIPPEELILRIKRKEQLKIKKEKNKELRAKIAQSKAIEKSQEKKTIKKNNEDINYLKQEIDNLKSQVIIDEKNNKNHKIIVPVLLKKEEKNSERISANRPIQQVITQDCVINKEDINKKEYDKFMAKLRKHL